MMLSSTFPSTNHFYAFYNYNIYIYYIKVDYLILPSHIVFFSKALLNQFLIYYIHLFSHNHIIPPDNRTRIEPQQKQRDRKCPVFKAFQSLNVPNFLFKLRDFESFTLSKRSKIGISYIYFSIYLIFPIYYHIKLYHKCITTLTFMIHLLHFFNMLILYHTFDL